MGTIRRAKPNGNAAAEQIAIVEERKLLRDDELAIDGIIASVCRLAIEDGQSPTKWAAFRSARELIRFLSGRSKLSDEQIQKVHNIFRGGKSNCADGADVRDLAGLVESCAATLDEQQEHTDRMGPLEVSHRPSGGSNHAELSLRLSLAEMFPDANVVVRKLDLAWLRDLLVRVKYGKLAVSGAVTELVRSVGLLGEGGAKRGRRETQKRIDRLLPSAAKKRRRA